MDAEAGTIELSATWRQGSILPPSLLPDEFRDRVGVVVSHSCDLANASLAAEPEFEWIPASTVSATDGNLVRCRNPRILHLAGAGPRGEHLAFAMRDRRFADRRILSKFEAVGALSPEATALLSEWMARRYERAAFPDSFNERRRPIARTVRKRLGTSAGSDMLGLWAALSSDEELETGDDYRIVLMATVHDDLATQKLDAVDELLAFLAEQLGSCEGIEVRGAPVVARESDVTLAMLRRYQRLDDWDDLSRT